MQKKTIIIFETADEIIAAFGRIRSSNDTDSIVIPESVTIIKEDKWFGFTGEGSAIFQISESVTWEDLVKAAFRRSGCRDVNFT